MGKEILTQCRVGIAGRAVVRFPVKETHSLGLQSPLLLCNKCFMQKQLNLVGLRVAVERKFRVGRVTM